MSVLIFKTLKSFRLLKLSEFLPIIFAIIKIFTVHAQDQHLPSRFLTVKDGLPQGFVSGIVQDKAGFVWISTRNGLARYDGKKFKVFYHNSNDTTSIAGNIIRNIFLDSRNRLWIKYESAGLDLFYPETEKIQHVSNQPGLEVLKEARTEIGGIYEDIKQGLLLNTVNHGFIQVTINSRVALQYPLIKIIPPLDTIFGVTQNKAQHLFVLTNKSLYHLNEKLELVIKIPFIVPPSIIRTNENRYGMFFHSDSVLLISGSNAVVKYGIKNNQFTMVSISPAIKTLWGLQKYSLLFPDNEKGIFTFAGSSTSYTFKTHSAVNIASLLDRTNVLWLGASGDGIQLVHLRHNSFQYHKYTPPLPAFLLNKYFGTGINTIPEALASTNTYTLRWTYDKTGMLWMSNKDRDDREGMQVYAYKNNVFSRPDWHYANGEKIRNDAVSGIATDSKNTLWVLTNGYRISKLDPLTGVIQSFSPLLPQPVTGGEESLLIDKRDNFWIASDSGLFLYREGWKSYIQYSLSSKNIANLESNRFLNIAEDRHDENKLWMGSIGNGLVCFDKKEKKFTVYNKSDGLPDNTIYSVMADGNGYLWCSTNQGIFRFDPPTKKARKYAAEDGSPDFEFNRFHYLRLPNGQFVFGGSYDYVVFDPLSMKDDTSYPDVAITSWKINNRPAEYRDAGSPLSQAINSLDEVHLTYQQNFLTFEFAALQYDQPEIFQYRYKLSGIDKDWVYAGNNNSLNYTALPPGQYTLSINAANAAGLWSNKMKKLLIIIDPPWWKTWWAYLFYFLLTVAVICLVLQNRLKQLHLRNQVILRQKEAMQMKQLDELKSHFFSNITHELRTPLTLIISPVEKHLRENGENYSSKVLKGVRQNARHLLKLINQLLDLSKLEAGNMQLSLQRGELVLFIEQLVDAFKPHAEAKQIGLSFMQAEVNGEYIFDSDKLEKTINNLLSNALKFTPEGGSIFLELSVKDKSNPFHLVEITIKDTGIGISARNLPHIFSRFFQADNSSTRKYEGTGIGLSLVHELVKLMDGNIEVESEEGRGTRFLLTLPVQPALATSGVSRLMQAVATPEQFVQAAQYPPAPAGSPTAAVPFILITDDNNELRGFITECLQPHYRIIAASNGREGLQMAQNEMPDVIISDVMMPEMDGYEFCQKIKESKTTNHIAFIMLTAKTALESKMSGLRLGADDYINKPFHVEELLMRLSNLLKRQEKLREFYRGQLQPGMPVPVINEMQDAFLKDIYQAIEKHLDNEALSVETLAAEVAVSRRTLDRKLSALAGMSANEMIRSYRLKKAEEFLQKGYNVTETTNLTGFSSPSWFTRCFKEMYGKTPLAYMQNRRQ